MERLTDKSEDAVQGSDDGRPEIRRSQNQILVGNQQHLGRKLQSLLELGQIIGLDLDLDKMLYQIARKTAEVMEADRCSVFLYDPLTDELWTTVALGIKGEVIRIPSGQGIAGHCFQKKEALNLSEVYEDPRFNREVDAKTGYRTRSILCLPIYTRSQEILGVIQVLNKREGVFSEEDQAFLKTFANQTAIFLEMAQLQKARIEALEQSREELRLLNRAKDKALHHLSHELRTPLSVIKGNLSLLKRRIAAYPESSIKPEVFDTLENHLTRLLEIQRETEEILRSCQEGDEDTLRMVGIWPMMKEVLGEVKSRSSKRILHFELIGEQNHTLLMDAAVLAKIVEGLLKNAAENSPDEGAIQVSVERRPEGICLQIIDHGQGITAENQAYLFDGLFHTQETDLYTSKKPYDFNAGGKGLDLLRTKMYAQRFGFLVSMESRRCRFIPRDEDLCPGRISQCPHCQSPEDCVTSGGSTFRLLFPIRGGKRVERVSSSKS